MAHALVSAVEPLGVDSVDLLPDPGQIGVRCFHEQVVVVAHQAVGMAEVATDRKGFSQDLKKAVLVRSSRKIGCWALPRAVK